MQKVDKHNCKKVIIIVILNDTPKTVTEQQRYHEGNREEFLEKGGWNFEENKQMLQKWLKIIQRII